MARKFRGRQPRIPSKSGPPRFLLDQFSETDVVSWRRHANAELEYASKIYFHLEAERGLHSDAIRGSLVSAKALCLRLESWMRIFDYRYSLEPLSTAGSLRKSGRFNIGRDVDPSRFPPFPALYLAEDYETAFSEKFGGPVKAARDSMSGPEFSLRSPSSFTSVRVNGQIRQLFDLTEIMNLRRFVKIIAGFRLPDELLALAREASIPRPYMIGTPRQLKSQLLTNDWRLNPTQFGIPSNSQVFARLVRDAGFEGILYQSVRGSRRCIVLFPDRLAHGESYVELADPAPRGMRWSRLDARTWQERRD